MCHNTDPEEYELLDEKTGSNHSMEVFIHDVQELPVLSDEEIMTILNLYKHERN
jgi:hypothetical protein